MIVKVARALAAGVAAGAMVAGCSDHNAVDPTAGNPKGYLYNPGTTVVSVAQRRPVPDITGTLLDGSPFDLSAWSGQVVVVNFWGSWCADCRAEAAALEAVAQASAPLGVHVIGVNVRDNVAQATAFDRTHGITYPSIEDQDEVVALQFPDLAPDSIPTTVIIDRRGREAARLSGQVDYTQLLALVRQLSRESG